MEVPEDQGWPRLRRLAAEGLVTGGSRGIGREVSTHLAALGARVVINYASDSAKASALAAELNNTRGGLDGVRAVAVLADVSDPASVRALFDRAEEAFGSAPHIVVACAGLLNPKDPALADTTVEDFDAMFAVTSATRPSSGSGAAGLLFPAAAAMATGSSIACTCSGLVPLPFLTCVCTSLALLCLLRLLATGDEKSGE